MPLATRATAYLCACRRSAWLGACAASALCGQGHDSQCAGGLHNAGEERGSAGALPMRPAKHAVARSRGWPHKSEGSPLCAAMQRIRANPRLVGALAPVQI